METFIYRGFRLDDTRHTVHFDYAIQRATGIYELSESLSFPTPLPDSAAVAAGLRGLHLALGISYYKIFLLPEIEHPYSMTVDEADFWNEVWRNGLGEFLYVNKLPAERLSQFISQEGSEIPPGLASTSTVAAAGAILGIGGGKDSIVAGELLKSCAVPVEGFVMATGAQRGQAQAVAEVMDIPLHAVERVIDPQLLQLQEQPGAYKGHIPISLIFGLVGTVLALATGKQYVVVANEASASIPGLSWQGSAVNHQWSKSFRLEQRLQAYVQSYVTPDITYFSAIRPLTSIAVAKLFAAYPQYYEVFTSDNFIFRMDAAKRPTSRWGLESPKSLSSFILLAPWITEADMLRIFGRNFLEEVDLEPLLLRLTGLEGHPPLDCVGTVEELVLSLNLLASQGKFTQTYLAQLAQKRGLIDAASADRSLAKLLELSSDQAFPADLRTALTTKLQAGVQA